MSIGKDANEVFFGHIVNSGVPESLSSRTLL
jgi:hypothetical protein